MEKYNGWTNFETWKVNLEFFDGADRKGCTADELKDEVEEFIDGSGDCIQLVKNWASSFVSEVNWHEIADGLNEE